MSRLVDVPGQWTLSDARTLRALSHPIRLSLIEALRAGPLTATEAGAIIGETATTCSFHLRQLAVYGIVEEAGGGRGRARPWRLLMQGWSAPPRPDDVEFTQASRALDHVMLNRSFERIRHFVDEASSYPRRWQHAASASTTVLHLTPAELEEVNAAVAAALEKFRGRWAERTTNPALRPKGTKPVEVFYAAYPTDTGRSAK